MRINGRFIGFIFLTTMLLASGLLSQVGIAPLNSSTEGAMPHLIDDMLNPGSSNPEMMYVTSGLPPSTTGTGLLLPVIEYANGTFVERSARANESGTFYSQRFDIPEGWHTTQITAISSEMYHLRDWMQNGDFSSITGWLQDEYDVPGVVTENYDTINDWITIVRASGGKVQYDYWGSWNQTVQVTEGGAASATLNVTYKIDTTTGTNGQNAQPYLYVNGSMYELPSGGARFGDDLDWTTYSVELPLSEFTFPGNLEVALGIQGWAGTQFQTQGTLTCDNVTLTLTTSRLSEVVDLGTRDTEYPSNTVQLTTGAGGKGYGTLSGNWTDYVELEFLANETGTEFTLDLFMHLIRNNNLDTNTYTVANGTDATWDSAFTAREMAYPFTYHYFNVSIPHDWTLNLVHDAYNDLQLSGTTYYNATYFGTESTLVCDVYGTGVSGTPHYGTWTFSSISPNYGKALSSWGAPGGFWTETVNFYPNSALRVNVSFSDGIGTPPATPGSGSLTLYDAETQLIYTESGGDLDGLGLHTYQNGTGTSNITIKPTWLAGPITAIASWNNGTSVGETRNQLFIYHRTELEIEAALYSAFRGDTVSIRVKYVDSETGLGIPAATLYFNWTYGSAAMGYAGNGWYAGYVDTSMATIGAYPVVVNASKEYNDFAMATGITIEIQERTTLFSPRNLRTPTTDYEIPWGNSKVIYLAYEDTIAMNPTALSANPGNPGSPDVSDTYTSNNVYATVTSVGNEVSLTIETNVTSYDFLVADLTSLSYKIEGKFSAAVDSGTVYAYNFSSSSWAMIIDSYKPFVDTTLSWKTSKPADFISADGIVRARVNATHSASFSYNLDLFDFVANRPIDDTEPGVSITSDWPVQSVVGTQVGPVFNTSLDIWQVTLNTMDVVPGEYTVLVEASATGHQSKSLELTIVVRAHQTRASVAPPSATPWSWKTWISVSIVNADNSSIVLSENNISLIQVESTFGIQMFTSSNWTYSDSSGYAEVALYLDTSAWDIGSHSVTVTVTTSGTGLSKFFDDGITAFEMTIRAHDMGVSVAPPPETPWTWKTNVSVRLTDLDNSTLIVGPDNVTQIVLAGQTFTSADWTYSNGVYWFFVDTSDWSVSSNSYNVLVTTSGSPQHFSDGAGTVIITLRSHILIVSVSPPASTPWSWTTDVTVTLVDLDNSTLTVSQDNVTQIVIAGQTFTASDWTYSAGTFTCTVDTSAWAIGSNTYPVTVTTSSAVEKFYNDGSSSTIIAIREHLLGISITPPPGTPWSWKTNVSVALVDLDNSTLTVSQDNVTQIVIAGQTFTASSWAYSAGTFTCTVDTSAWVIGSDTYPVIVTTSSAVEKFYNDGSSSAIIEIREHLLGISVSPPPGTPWSWKTNVSVALVDLDNSTLTVSQNNVTQIVIAGQTFTASSWTYSAGIFTCRLDTSAWVIGSGTYSVAVTTSSAVEKFYRNADGNVAILVVSHTMAVEVVRPAATPWSENTTLTIRVLDLNNGSLTILPSNISKIVIAGQTFTSTNWTYSAGEFILTIDTDGLAIGSYIRTIQVTTSEAPKQFADGSTTVNLEVRDRYTEAYSPSPDPVPYLDDLVFYVEFRDRDAAGALVNTSSILLNGTGPVEGNFTITWISEGYYRVSMLTTSLVIGNHQVIATCVRNNFENATTTVRFRIRLTETEAVASGYRFDVPLGTNVTFSMDFIDIDHNNGIVEALLVNNGTFGWSYNDLGGGVYEVEIEILDSTALGSYTLRFNLTKTSFEDAYVLIVITVKTHSTYLSFDEPVLPTGIGSSIEVYLFYEDVSMSTGISNATGSIIVDVNNSITISTIFTVQNNTDLGVGHYIILIPADQFGGLYDVSFTVFFNWTGAPLYLNLTRNFSVELRGTQTDLSVYIAPPAIYYGDWVNFTLYYENTDDGMGIDNSTGNVWVSAEVETAGQSIDPSDFQISSLGNGRYQFLLNSSLFTAYGSFIIRAYMNWNASASPYLENRTLALTITLLVRTTLLDVVPPVNTAYDENATFTFTFTDSPSNSLIENSSQLHVQLDNVGLIYWLSYDTGSKAWTVIVNTTSIGVPGTINLALNVSWGGTPFYQNQTRFVRLEVTYRATQLTYTAPTPTFFNSNVTIDFTYLDLIDGSSAGMDTGTLVLTSAGLDIAGNYTVIDNGDGTYTVVLNTTAFLEPGAYLVNAQMTYGGSRYGNNANAQFTFSVLYRAILATADPVGNTAWLQNIEVTLHLTDGETATLVSNSTGGVRIDLASQNATDPDILSLATTWTPGTNTYDVVISNTLGIGTHIIFLNVSYDYGAPFYGYRVVKLTISIRKHSTELQLYEPAAQTGFGLDTTFQLRYVDLDTGLPIEGASISINNITLNGNWTITPIGGNLYEIRINTSAFLEIGNYWIELETQNSGALANYADTTIYVRVYVRERHTLLAYDPVGTVGYTDNVTITVYYSDSDLGNSGITNVTSALRLITNQTIYYVSNGAQPGSFVIELPANQFVAFEYTALRINMTYFGVPYYQNQTIVIRFQITGTSTEFVWDPSDPVPYGNRANITFYWGDLDSGSPVNCVLGDDTEITVQSVTQPGLNTSNPMILMVVQGQDVGGYATFFLLLNTSYLDDYRTYEFRISLDWTNSSQVPYYEDQLSKLVSIIVRMRDTAVPQVQADPIPYGENATIRLQYVDLDNASLLITGSSLNISVSDGLTYYVNPNPVGGFYEIEIMTHGTGLLGSTQINITIEWYGKPFFENQTTVKVILNINPRIVNIEIDYPASTPYMDNFTFYIYIQDTHSMEYINNNESFISSVFRVPNIAEKPVIHYIGGSNGKYMITFDTTLFGQTGSYILEIAFNHTYSAPYYAIILRNVSGVVRTRATNLDYEPVIAVPYGNYMIFNVTYSDVDESPSVGIDSAQIYLLKSGEPLNLGVDFWYQYTGNGVYTINVSTVALGAPNTYSLQIIANSTADWWFSESSRSITASVSYRNVELSTVAPDMTYYDDVTFFTITLIDIDNGTSGTGLESMSGYLSVVFASPSGVSNASVQIVEVGNGVYNISFDTNILGVLSDYEVEVTFNAPYEPNYWKSTNPRVVRGRISARLTQLSYDVSGATPYLDNVSITLVFEDIGASAGITGASFILTTNETLTEGTDYWVIALFDGEYNILVNSTVLGLGESSIEIRAECYGIPFYQNRTVNVPVQVRERATRLTYTPPAETPFGDNLTVTLRYYDVDAGLVAIPDAQSHFTLDTVNGTPVDSSYYWVEYVSGATYHLIVNTTKLDIYGYYNLTISVSGTTAYYENQTIWFGSDVRVRNTHLTTAPIAQTSYTQNATIVFYYVDLDAGVGVDNSTGGVSVALNTTTDWWVEQISPGTFRVIINATDLGATGEFGFRATFAWIGGKPHYANRSLEFTVSVTGSGAILSYTPPPHIPIGDNITLIVEYKDSGTGNGISNSSGYIHITIIPLNNTVMGPFQYWLENPEPGRFVYSINSTPFWTTGPIFFEVNVIWMDGQIPYYPDINGTVVRSVIRNIYTQTIADAPSPGIVPIGDNMSVVISFYDLDHDNNVLGADIDSNWPYGWSYAVLGDGRFNVTLSTTGITTPSEFSVQFTFNKTFYLTKIAAVQITIRLLSTISTTTSPDPPIVPVGDTVILEVTYYDTDHQVNITDGNIQTDWIYGWAWTNVTNGGFRVTLYTENVTNLIKYTVTFTVTRDGCSQGVASVKFEVRSIRTGISADVPGTTVVGSNVTVTVTVEDLDHGTGVEGATIHTTAPIGTYSWIEVGNGAYEIIYFLWQESYGTYTYDISAVATNHDSSSLNVDIDLRQVRTELYIDSSIILVNWSNQVNLAANYDNLDVGGLVPDATVKATLGGLSFDLSSNGTAYVALIDTALVDVGTYIIIITANKTNYETRIVQVTLVVSVLQTVFESVDGLYSYSIVSGGYIDLLVYYHETTFGLGVSDATVSYLWDYGNGQLVTNGTPGYYTATINATGALVNIYTLYVRANKTNHAEASIYFSLDVHVVETELTPVGELTLRVTFGEIATLLVNYTNTNLNEPVTNASLYFRFSDANYTGILTEYQPGIYNGTIDTSQLYAGTFSLYVVATKAGYETCTLGLLMEAARIDTILALTHPSLAVVYESTATFFFNYTDTHYGLPIENATLEYRWLGGTGVLEEMGNGIYSVNLDSALVGPGLYDIHVSASKSNYVFRTASSTLEVRAIATEIIVDEYYTTPVGDALIIHVFYNDTSYNRTVSDATAVAVWDFGNPNLVHIGDGEYTFTVPETVAIDTYYVTFILSKANHETASVRITVIVREIATELTTLSGNEFVSVTIGELVQITAVYMDTDHSTPISNAAISVLQESGIIDENDWTVADGDAPGQYIISFIVPVDQQFSILIRAQKGTNYDAQEIIVVIVAAPVVVDPLMTMITYGGGLGVILLLIGALLYVKIFSIPKVIRRLNGMIKAMSKGKIPEAPEAPGRDEIIQEIINTGLADVNIFKPIDEIPSETIELVIPETKALLSELAEITGLTEDDVSAFNADLMRMKPSDRSGFLMEVIRQEKARRSEDIAEKEKEKKVSRKTVTNAELDEVRAKFEAMGFNEEQLELLIENAKNLTKAEIDTLLKDMGGFVE